MSPRDIDVESFLDRLRSIASDWDNAHSELESMRISATSSDGIATAVADSAGSLIDLSVDPGARDLGPAAVASSVLDASANAVTWANNRRAQLISDSVGAAVHDRRATPPAVMGEPEGLRGTG